MSAGNTSKVRRFNPNLSVYPTLFVNEHHRTWAGRSLTCPSPKKFTSGRMLISQKIDKCQGTRIVNGWFQQGPSDFSPKLV